MWLQCSTGETQLFQYFNTVFLKILNAPLRLVFANPVTNIVACCILYMNPLSPHTITPPYRPWLCYELIKMVWFRHNAVRYAFCSQG